jgi:hypothetical protein
MAATGSVRDVTLTTVCAVRVRRGESFSCIIIFVLFP